MAACPCLNGGRVSGDGDCTLDNQYTVPAQSPWRAPGRLHPQSGAPATHSNNSTDPTPWLEIALVVFVLIALGGPAGVVWYRRQERKRAIMGYNELGQVDMVSGAPVSYSTLSGDAHYQL